MVASQAEQDDAVVRSAFRRLDTNGDHYVTFDEIASTLASDEEALHRIKKTQGLRTELDQFIQANDADSNRKLDEDEFVQAMKRFAIVETSEGGEEDSFDQVEAAINDYEVAYN